MVSVDDCGIINVVSRAGLWRALPVNRNQLGQELCRKRQPLSAETNRGLARRGKSELSAAIASPLPSGNLLTDRAPRSLGHVKLSETRLRPRSGEFVVCFAAELPQVWLLSVILASDGQTSGRELERKVTDSLGACLVTTEDSSGLACRSR